MTDRKAKIGTFEKVALVFNVLVLIMFLLSTFFSAYSEYIKISQPEKSHLMEMLMSVLSLFGGGFLLFPWIISIIFVIKSTQQNSRRRAFILGVGAVAVLVWLALASVFLWDFTITPSVAAIIIVVADVLCVRYSKLHPVSLG